MLMYIRTLLAGAMLASSAAAADTHVDFTFYAASHHFKVTTDKPINERKHDMLGLEFRNLDRGLGVVHYTNTYWKQSTGIMYSEYWQKNNWEFSLTGGVISGYNSYNECRKGKTVKYCFVGGASISYNEYRLKPKLTLMGDRALVFSLSWRY